MSTVRICPIHGIYNKSAFQGCPKCSKTRAKVYDTFNRDQNLDEFYHSKSWKSVRVQKLKQNPVCQICNREKAVIVDHIKEIKDGGSKLSLNNLQSLCRACHNSKTAKERQKREGLC